MKLRSALELMEWYTNMLSKGNAELVSRLILDEEGELRDAIKKVREFINEME